jgi:hypothetical protein
MQRTEDGYIIISCDYCATDWDEVRPMIEGHRGSVLCLNCLKIALSDQHAAESEFFCNLCVREHIPVGTLQWTSPATGAHACQSCLLQAAGTFSKDPDVDWTWDRKQGR